ncbi:membrane protein [Corynebacterium testudinoris]|uniref:Glucitol operon activator n=1 Tax=Corynebacterium testudinoris TaxID=136857 RepID=A0A0G3H880_9CORY|nr:membrane protein [Corynebacterium testudinoris]AKK09559.1 glucitol operon activator [Corynebacterium testudinoris]
MSDDNGKKRERKRVRASHLVFLTLAVGCTLALAWWQWSRFQEGSGTFQNLGYALQWPLFGAFFVFAYRKYLEYENDMIEASNSADDAEFLYQADEKRFREQVTEIDEDFLPQRPTIDVDTFNEINTPRRGASRDRTDNGEPTS